MEEELEEWELEGWESKEEYEDFLAKSAEDPLYGWGDVLSMKELRQLLEQAPYKPTGMDANYPDHLLLDEKTGMYYTDFFKDQRTHMVLGHILAVECMECENLDWEHVTGGYSPYIIARFQDMCVQPLQRKDGKLVEDWGDVYPGETFVDFFEWDADRAVWFADNLPTRPYLYSDDEKYFLNRFHELGLQLKNPNGWICPGVVQWDILTTDYLKIECASLDNNDPYHTKIEVAPWNKHACLNNLELIKEKRGVEKVRQVVQRFRYDWRRIASFDEFNLDKLSFEQKENFRYFLFEGLEYYLDEWTKEAGEAAEKQPIKEEKPQPMEQQHITLEDVFSMRFKRTPEYGKLLHFLEIERTEASDGDWARYALALSKADIFVHSPKTFKGWLPRFCELFDRHVPYQDPNKLNRTTCQKDISVYLPDWKKP